MVDFENKLQSESKFKDQLHIRHTGNGASMVERTNEQQRVLEKRRADLAERRKAERSAAQELEAKEEQGEELEKTYTSLQAEVRKAKFHKRIQNCGNLQATFWVSFCGNFHILSIFVEIYQEFPHL